MEIIKYSPEIYVITGKELHSNATLITHEEEVFLVDGLASKKDAEDLLYFVQHDIKKHLSFAACTHYFSDHMAAFPLLKQTLIIAHQDYEQTFKSEVFCSEEELERFVSPTITFSDKMTFKWGKNTLNFFYNPGHTLSNISIDVPEADIIITGDHTVGNIVYLHYSTPSMIRSALQKIKLTNRGKIITGHNGISSIEKVETSLMYLDNLEQLVKQTYLAAGINGVLNIKVEQCVASNVKIEEFDVFFHKRNLQTVIERGLFDIFC